VLRALRCAAIAARRPDRHPGHPPSPVPGRWINTGFTEVLAAARPPRQSCACGFLGVTAAAEAPLLVDVRSASLQPLRQASWHIGRGAAPPRV